MSPSTSSPSSPTRFSSGSGAPASWRCPTREAAEGKPVKIGSLQRYAVDAQMATGKHPYARAAATGKKIAVVGAGPAGLACAHALSVAGHDVVIYDARPKVAGLNEYGIAAYKTPDDFAAREAAFILGVGGIETKTGVALGRDIALETLAKDYDAVFLGLGLPGVNKLGLPGEDTLKNVEDAVAFIAELRQAKDLAAPAHRPPCRRHRRRHDGGGCGGAVQAPRRRTGDHRLSPRRRGHEGQPL